MVLWPFELVSVMSQCYSSSKCLGNRRFPTFNLSTALFVACRKFAVNLLARFHALLHNNSLEDSRFSGSVTFFEFILGI